MHQVEARMIRERSGIVISKELAQMRKSGLPVIGEGKYQVELDTAWLESSSKAPLGATHDIVSTDDGSLLLAQEGKEDSRSSSGLHLFSSEGTWQALHGESSFGSAHSIHVHYWGGRERFYCCDDHGCFWFSAGDLKCWDGSEVCNQSSCYGDGQTSRPTNRTFFKNGRSLVSDGYGHHWIHILDVYGNLVKSWGGPERFNQPHGVSVIDGPDGSEKVVVADRANHRLVICSDEDGTEEAVFSEGLSRVCNAVQEYGGESRLLVPQLDSRVSILSEKGDVLFTYGYKDILETYRKKRPDERPNDLFIAPHYAKWVYDTEGNLLGFVVCEWLRFGRVSFARFVS